MQQIIIEVSEMPTKTQVIDSLSLLSTIAM